MVGDAGLSFQLPELEFRIDADDLPEDQYDEVACKACNSVHFVNPKTGRVLGQRDE